MSVLKWDGKVLREFVHASGLTEKEFAEQFGIKHGTLLAYMHGRAAPNFGTFCRLADVFGVTLDELAGRDVPQNARNYLFGEHQELVAALERKYQHKLDKRGIVDEPLASWPYNLLKAIFGEWNKIMTEDQEAGFWKKIMELPERDQDILLQYYRDGKTLQEIGNEYGVSRERIRQKNAKSVRRLRHPTMAKCIKLGLNGAKMAEEQREKDKELYRRESAIKARENFLNKVEERIEERQRELDEKRAAFDEDPITEADIAVLNLSVRSYNALWRGIKVDGKLQRIDTIEKLLKVASDGDLMSVRNLGKKSVQEICAAIEEYIGLDFFEENGVEKRTF